MTSDSLDYATLRKELLAALRGSRSQGQLNRRLASRSNQIYRWESGVAQVAWPDFVRFCGIVKAPIDRALSYGLAFRGRSDDCAALLRHLNGGMSQASQAKLMGVSRPVVSKWMSGRNVPSLDQVLRAVHASVFSLTEFLGVLVDLKALPSIREEFRRDELEKQLHYFHPWVSALLRCLETVEYNRLARHVPGYLAAKLGITREQEEDTLKKLLELGIVEPEGARYRTCSKRLKSQGAFEGEKNIRLYWARRAIEYLDGLTERPERSMWGYKILSCTPEAYRRIREKYFEFYQTVDSIVFEDMQGADRVLVMNLQILDLEEMISG